MPLTTEQLKSIGPDFDVAIDSPTSGFMGLHVKPNTFSKDLQTQLRDDVISALTLAIADRDLAFWKRQSQNDWSLGEGQEYFSNPSRYSQARSLDIHTPGQLRLVPQPTRLRVQTAALNGRGGVYCQTNCFFAWIDGQYTWVDNLLTSNLSTVPAGAKIGDIDTDGLNVFFALYNANGIWSTAGAAPGAAAAYDTSGSNWGRLTYDQLKKTLYAATSAATGLARLDKIVAGGASVVIYDFVTGRIDTIEMHQGNVVVGWNDAAGTVGATGAIGRSHIFKYDGTTMSLLADLPDGMQVVGLKSALGVLIVFATEQDPLDPQNAPPAAIQSVYAVVGSTITRIGTITGQPVGDAASGKVYVGSESMAITVGQSVFTPAAGFIWRYDLALGGLSRSLGDDGVPGLVNTFAAAVMTGIALMSGGGVMCSMTGAGNTGGIFNLNGTIFGITPSSPQVGTCKLTSSRMDAGLPYVPKFWYDFQTVFSPLLAGESVEMEYSLTDGKTWVACTNSPFNTVGASQANFVVVQRNPHARYRVKLVANPGVTKGPILFSVSLRYAVLNPNASVYRMTLSCADQIRGRGNAVETPGYGRAALDFLDAVARNNEIINFYEPDDPTRTVHPCWVMSMRRPMPNTSGVYDPKKAEGDVELVLWETV